MTIPFTKTLDITKLKPLSKEVLNAFLQSVGERPEESKADALKKAEGMYGDAPPEPAVIPEDAEDADPHEAAKKVVESWLRSIVHRNRAVAWYRRHRAQLHSACDVFRHVRYVYSVMGPYESESHYQVALMKELETAVWHGGVRLNRNAITAESVGPIRYRHSDGMLLTIDQGASSRTDIVISDADANLRLILELKAAAGLMPANYAQLRRYLIESKRSGQGDFKGLLVLFGHRGCSVVAFDSTAKNMNLFTYTEELKTNWYV